MGRNLSNLFISQSYQFITQISGSELQDGLGNTITGSLLITASKADNATSASQATSASYSNVATSSSYALVSTSSSFAINATNAVSASVATSASYALTASFALNAGSTVSTSSLLVTASAVSNVITFTKGDGSTFPVTVATGSTVSSSFASTASLALNNVLTASSNNATITYTKGDGTTFTNVINNVVNANTASFALTASKVSILDDNGNNNHKVTFVNTTVATGGDQILIDPTATQFTYNPSTNLLTVTASLANTAVSASQAQNAVTASFAQTIASGLSPTFANVTASNVLITGTASVALLYTQTISSSVIYSSGSNQFGDASNDVQTLYGTFNVVNGPSNFTGSVNSVNGYTGSLLGTASFATSASQAVTASYVASVVSASFATSASQATSASFAVSSSRAVSSSFATTASFALNAPASNPFPFTGSAVITGSLVVSGSITAYPTLQTETAYNLVWGNVILGQGGTIASGYQHAILGGVTSTIDGGRASTVIGGEGNRIKGGGTYDTIIGGGGNIIETPTGGYNAIIASYLATLQSQSLAGNYVSFAIGTDTSKAQGYASGVAASKGSTASGRQTFVAGTLNSFAQGDQAAIIASSGSTISASNAAIIGGTGIVATANNTVYVPNLVVTGSTTGVVGNNADTYTSSPRVNQVITLTQAEYNAIGSPDANTFYIISGSLPNATLGSNTFTGNQVFSGSVRGVVISGSTTSNTASFDFSSGNFFTLNTNNVLNTQITPYNIQPGQTVNLEITYPATSSTITFPSFVKQPSGSAYVSSGANKTDILTFIVFNTSSVYLSSIKNMI